METSMPQTDAEGLHQSTKGASPSAYYSDGPLKGNRNFLQVLQDSRNLYFSTTQLETN